MNNIDMMQKIIEENIDMNDKVWLITGGTGSLGNVLTKVILEKLEPKRIVIFSRDELKQKEMKVKFNDYRLSFFLGDVRDLERMKEVTKGIDFVIHAAAIKDIIQCEKNPLEAIKTNIEGTKNVIQSCIENDLSKCVLISTDKAVYPVNLYGATKMIGERLFLDAKKSFSRTKFFVCRYGNVIASRGSVIEIFKNQKIQDGFLKITDERMTRFWITLEEVANFVIQSFFESKGQDIFIPKMESINIFDLANIIAEELPIIQTGIRESEKIHELLITKEESRHARIYNDKFIIDKNFNNPVEFCYSSEDSVISIEALKSKIDKIL